jgi:peptide subunit release factor 1 (eRF1)
MSLDFIRNYKPQHYGGPTSVITLAIPPDTKLAILTARMKKEEQTVQNIKNNTNRKSTLKAMSCINEYLRSLKTIPDTGLVLFAEQCI